MCESIPVIVYWYSSKKLPAYVIYFSFLLLLVNAGTTPKLETSWKHYQNKQWGYCVSYPARWSKAEAFEGSGMYVKTGLNKHSKAVAEMDINALPNRLNDINHATPISLTDNFRLHLEDLKRFQRAENLEVLEDRPTQLYDTPALLTKDRYFDPQDGSSWIDEIVSIERNQTLYTLELECRADQLARFEPAFNHFVGTFRFNCGRR